MRLIEGKTFYNLQWYSSYKSMMERCYREKANNYQYYGGRGITVCSEWHDIQNFQIWAEKSGYEKGMSLDRIDTDGDYCPENCRWATKKQQANNRRNTIYLERDGIKHTITEWAEILGIKRSTLNNRICRGWNAEKALARRNYYGKTD